MTLGIPAACHPDMRLPITPEGVAALADMGVRVLVEQDAGQLIHYPDARFARAGAEIVTRREALMCDVVLQMSPLSSADASCMRRGALLLTMLSPKYQDVATVHTLLQRNITSIALDLLQDAHGKPPFADVLNEIEGRAAVAAAASLLADPDHGKGILLGGVSGVIPCEVVIVGAGIAGCAAATSAIGLGAIVRMFDADVYRLRQAVLTLGTGIIASAPTGRVLAAALRSADVVVAEQMDTPLSVSDAVIRDMKDGVVVMELDACGQKTHTPRVFGTLRTMPLAHNRNAKPSPGPGPTTCFVNAGMSVPRTTAMALSDTLLWLFRDATNSGGFLNAIKINRGWRNAVYTFMGKPVNNSVAEVAGMRPVDIALLLPFS